MEKIDSFKGEFAFLSNFHSSIVMLDGIEYPTVEHAYQAAKTINPEARKIIKNAKTPGIAKKLGRRLKIRDDWENVKFMVMKSLVRDKFFNNPDLGQKLLNTGEAELIEGNWWGDTFWGVCKGKGKNMLGKILMDVRNELHKKMVN